MYRFNLEDNTIDDAPIVRRMLKNMKDIRVVEYKEYDEGVMMCVASGGIRVMSYYVSIYLLMTEKESHAFTKMLFETRSRYLRYNKISSPVHGPDVYKRPLRKVLKDLLLTMTIEAL